MSLVDRLRAHASYGPADNDEDRPRAMLEAADALEAQARVTKKEKQSVHLLKSLLKEADAEIERLTNMIGTWRESNDANWQELMDIAKAKLASQQALIDALMECYNMSKHDFEGDCSCDFCKSVAKVESLLEQQNETTTD